MQEERVLLELPLLENMCLGDGVGSRCIDTAELPWLQKRHLNIRLLGDADKGC